MGKWLHYATACLPLCTVLHSVIFLVLLQSICLSSRSLGIHNELIRRRCCCSGMDAPGDEGRAVSLYMALNVTEQLLHFLGEGLPS